MTIFAGFLSGVPGRFNLDYTTFRASILLRKVSSGRRDEITHCTLKNGTVILPQWSLISGLPPGCQCFGRQRILDEKSFVTV